MAHVGRVNQNSTAACPLCKLSIAVERHIDFPGLSWRRCRACGFGFLDPYVPELSREDEENIASTYEQYHAVHVPRSVTQEKANWVISSTQARQVLLVEIGPGQGELLSLLREVRPVWTIVAVEPRVEFREALIKQGLPVVHSIGQLPSATDQSSVPQRFEEVIFVLDNVLEHICNPMDALREVAGLGQRISARTRILVEVPNEQGLRRRARIQDFLRGTPKPPTFAGHVNLFEERSLRQVATQASIRNVKVVRHPIREPDQVRYTMRVEQLPGLVRLAIAMLRLLPVDRWLGWEYWLRAVLVTEPESTLDTGNESQGADQD